MHITSKNEDKGNQGLQGLMILGWTKIWNDIAQQDGFNGMELYEEKKH